VLDDKRVSSKHFRLFKHGGDVMIEDLSANGTFVNETRLVKDKPVPIHNGDQVGLLLEMKQAGTKPSKRRQTGRLCDLPPIANRRTKKKYVYISQSQSIRSRTSGPRTLWLHLPLWPRQPL